MARNWGAERTNEEGRSEDGARLIHVSTYRSKLGGERGPLPAAKGSGGEEALLERRAGEEPLHKSEAHAVCICCSAKSGLKKEMLQNHKKVSPCSTQDVIPSAIQM